MRKTHRIPALILALVLGMMVLLTGCAPGGTETPSDTPPAVVDKTPEPSKEGTDEPSAPADDLYVLGEEPLEISFYGNYDWYTMPKWGDDAASKWILDNKKVNVVSISSDGNAAQKLSTMIVSGDLPDVIWLERGADVEQLRANGMLVAFDDYLDKYTNLKTWGGDSTLDLLRSPDGKVYQFPNWYTLQPNGNTGYVVNKKIYKELGSPKLETTDDLYAYLKQVKDKYPGVVPFEAATGGEGIEVLSSAFGEKHPNTFSGSMLGVPNEETRKMESVFTNSVYREAMVYASRLFREGLMSQDTFTQQAEQVKQKVMTGQVAVYAASSPTEYGNIGDTLLKTEDPEAGYFMIWPIHKPGLNQKNIYPGTYNQLGWNVAVITTAAKNPEAIFAFWDWMTGPEGQATMMWGPNGLYWDGFDDELAPKFNERFVTDTDERDKLMNATSPLQWCGNTVYVDQSKSKFEKTLPEDQRRWDTYWQSEITWHTQYNTSEWININPPGDIDEGIVQTTVQEIYDQARAKAIQTAASDEEVLAILDQAERDAQQAGYTKLLDYKTARWLENLEKMGR